MKKLSLLICSIETRHVFLNRLVSVINPQLTDQIEMVVNCDNGEKPIGKKRNELIKSATGEYVAFIDDDDLIAENYIAKIIQAIGNTNCDCVGIEGIMTTDGKTPRKFIHSLQYKTWFEKDEIYYRNPNHLNPIKREIAIKIPFAEINHGEDSDFSKRVLPHLKTESYIEGPIYFYEFRTAKNIIPSRLKRSLRRRGHV